MRYELSQVETNRTGTGEQTDTAYEHPAVESRVRISGLLAISVAS